MDRPPFVGRREELTRLGGVLDAARRGERAVALVGGEAGIGKTRLVTVLGGRARASSMEVLVGGCLDLVAGGVPYAPAVEALGGLARRLGPDETADLLGPEAAYLGLITGDQVGQTGALEGQTATLQAVHGLLARVARRRPLVFVMEDVHWADRSTRDLIAYLASGGTPFPLALIVTYRSDDVHSGHPLRRFLAEMERRPNVTHLRLERLGRADATAMLAAILGEAPPPALTEAIYQRSEGNPFFLEELAGAAASGDDLPPLLRDVMLARVEQLATDTQLVLRVAATAGRRFDHDALVAVAPLDDVAVADALREAHAANVITADARAGRYEFRHALLHEAVYADVLPGERRRYHTAYAEHLVATRPRPGIEEWAELAHHWRAAGAVDRALVATVEAGLAAEAGYALPEAHQYYELALELWDASVDPSGASITRSELLARAGEAASRTGAFGRAVDLATTALREVDARADPTTAALLTERRAWFLWRAGEEEQALVEYEEAVDLVPFEASPARARVLAAHADALVRIGQPAEARRQAESAVAIAAAVNAPFDEGHARHMLGLALGAEGHFEAGIEELHRARLLAEHNGDVADVAGTYVHLWRALAEQGRADEMVRLAIDAAEFCTAAGMGVAGLLLDCLAAGFLHQLGRWDEAEARLAGGDRGAWGVPVVVAHVLRGILDSDRGELVSAAEHLETARGLGAQISDGRINGLLYRGLAEVALWEVRPVDAAELAAEGIALTAGDDEMLARLAALGLRAVADDAEHHRRAGETWHELPLAAGFRTLLARLDHRARARRAPEASEVRAAVATGVAEDARQNGLPAVAPWRAAVQRWDHLGFPSPAAYARWRLGAALLVDGQRAVAGAVWAEAHAAATRLGAKPLAMAIEAAAARAAFSSLAADETAAHAAGVTPYGLTERELEVLALVATGRTNRQIGAALFISEKTASVHVSRILAKLDVSSRAQAAAVATQVGLAGGPAASGPKSPLRE